MKSKSSKNVKKEGFQWRQLIYVLIIIFLYVPLVFIGVRTFLPEYEDHRYPYKDCYMYAPGTLDTLEEQKEAQALHDACLEEQRAEQEVYDEEKRVYDTWKYLSVLGVVLLTLLVVMLIALDTPIKIGLFIGGAVSVFISTMEYFETESIPAFLVLLVVFGLVVFVIQKRKKFFG